MGKILIGRHDIQIALLLCLFSKTCHGRIPFLPRKICSSIVGSSSSSSSSSWEGLNILVRRKHIYTIHSKCQRSFQHSLLLARIRGGDNDDSVDHEEEKLLDQEEGEDLADEETIEDEEEKDEQENKEENQIQQNTEELSASVNTDAVDNNVQLSLNEKSSDGGIHQEEEVEEEEEEDDDDEEVDYDDEEIDEEEEEEEENDIPVRTKTKNLFEVIESKDTYDEPFALSPIQELTLTVGSMILFSKLNLSDPKIIRVARFFFIGYIIVVQLFLIYVRYQAKAINDRTSITVTNPINSFLQSQLSDKTASSSNAKEAIPAGTTNTMIKSIANSLLTSQTSIVEYDLAQAKSMNMSLLTPMLFLWFLHFKLGQVQPLFFQTLQGIKDLVTSPLFQVYVWKRKLERPFRNLKMEENGNEQQVEGEDLSSNVQEGNKESKVELKLQQDDDDDDEEGEQESDADEENEIDLDEED